MSPKIFTGSVSTNNQDITLKSDADGKDYIVRPIGKIDHSKLPTRAMILGAIRNKRVGGDENNANEKDTIISARIIKINKNKAKF